MRCRGRVSPRASCASENRRRKWRSAGRPRRGSKMPHARSPLVRAFMAAFGMAAGTGCITSHAWEHGTTKQMKELDVPPCGAVGMIDDAEDGDPQVLKRDGRAGYWFTF